MKLVRAMKQVISGVTPPEQAEVTSIVTWPSLGAIGFGQLLGQLCQSKVGFPPIVTLGNLIALLSIPLVVPRYFVELLFGQRYRLTNRRVIIERGLKNKELRSCSLDEFDTVDLIVLPGQEWYPCGELVFRKGTLETLRLSGVRNPLPFRATCVKAQRAYVYTKQHVG